MFLKEGLNRVFYRHAAETTLLKHWQIIDYSRKYRGQT